MKVLRTTTCMVIWCWFAGATTSSAQDVFFTTLYSFCSVLHCPSSYQAGYEPRGGLVQAADGNFYGTTYAGGAWELGTVFQITPGGALTTLHSFQGADGMNPTTRLLPLANGYLYGTTHGGGANNYGSVFSLAPSH